MTLKINKTHTLRLTNGDNIVLRTGASNSLVAALAARRIDHKHGKNKFDELQKAALSTNLRNGSETSILMVELERASNDINSVIADLMHLRKPRLPANLYDCLVRARAKDKNSRFINESSRIPA
jgi:hypothetical protein